jgi:sec-independent protein translocase protein TatC
MSAEMSLTEHLGEMRSRMIKIIIPITVLALFSLSFGFKSLNIPSQNLTIYYPVFAPFNNLAIQITDYMQHSLLPQGVRLIQTAPGQAFFAQIYVAFLIALIGGMPIIIRQIYGFIAPAFGTRTKKVGIMNVFLPTISLFICGVVFSYLFVIPFTLDFLYKYGQAVGAESFFAINDFISFVLQFFLGFGIAFELPMIMYAISLTGLVDSRFWRSNLRYAVLILVVFGALITPDGSGVTMWFISLPMIGLYMVGILATRRREKRMRTESNLISGI